MDDEPAQRQRPPDAEERIRTRISQAHWFDPTKYAKDCGSAPFVEATFAGGVGAASIGQDLAQVCWLDELFDGGVRLPTSAEGEPSQAITILLTGPPGTGKTTLATELCYRLSQPIGAQPPLRTLYVTTESPASWFIENAKSYDWSDAEKKIVAIDKPTDWTGAPAVHVFSAQSGEQLNKWLERNQASNAPIMPILHGVNNELGDVFAFAKGVESKKVRPAAKTARGIKAAKGPDVVVLDSLNTFDRGQSQTLGTLQDRFARFQAQIFNGPRIAILVFDSPPPGAHSFGFWEYVCDIVIRLDRSYPADSFSYMHRSIEIIKARYQAHAWGPHQFKIYESPGFDDLRSAPAVAQSAPAETAKSRAKAGATVRDADAQESRREFHLMQRAFPFRREGGVFILPSLHFLLSRYKRESSTDSPGSAPTPVPGLRHLLKGEGFPRGRCTAFMGVRGGHKSHLGFMQVLSGILCEELHQKKGANWPGAQPLPPLAQPKRKLEKAIVISLRDDDGITRDAMNRILQEWRKSCGVDPKASWPSVRQLEADGRLEIMYFPPGNISAEEFVHRVLMSVKRMKQVTDGYPPGNGAHAGKKDRQPHISLLFNSLDQLAHRFPLCFKQQIFISGLIQILSAEGVTSFFVTATSETTQHGDAAGAHGLDSIAELILRFEVNTKLDRDDYIKRIRAVASGQLTDAKCAPIKNDRRLIGVEVERYAGGQAAGAMALLELVKAEDKHFLTGVCDEGLNAIPMFDLETP